MSKPDIIFIVLDTQRADRLGCYGHQKAITPNLDRFASHGTLFEQAIAPAQWTIPSHASMFTGQYPTAHGVTQSSQGLSPDLPHLAESLREANYQTIGFCNNPLVGVLNNGFKRGFQTFYNYGGAFPSLPKNSNHLPWPLNWLVESYTQFLRRISYPIQNYFGRSDLAFRLSLNSWLTPIWSKFANFKGQNERSVRDVVHFLNNREERDADKPLFLFLNLMETHLPFWPPAKHVEQVAPYFSRSREAQNIMRIWNREAYRWGAPLEQPLGESERQVLHDMYDAEVAYQDDYLGNLFAQLERRSKKEDTLTIVVSDHGDGLGDHGYFGHAFVAYQELIHVPLIMQWPRFLGTAKRIDTPVSTRRIYHTILDAAGLQPVETKMEPATANGLTLLNTIHGADPEQGTAYSEVYPPLNFLRAIERHWPHLIDPFRCTSLRRAIVEKRGDGSAVKLINVDERPDEFFDVSSDKLESNDLLPSNPPGAQIMAQKLNVIATSNKAWNDRLDLGAEVEMEDEKVLRHLRGLGYID